MQNPLLESFKLPPFSKIKVEHIKPAIEKIINDNNASIESILKEGGGALLGYTSSTFR